MPGVGAGQVLGAPSPDPHAGAIRTLLANFGGGEASNKITALRQALSSATVQSEQPLTITNNSYNFVPTDINGLTFRRTPQQVLRILHGTANSNAQRGGFFSHRP